MNPRIRELARQAGIKFQPMILDGVEYDYEDVDMDGSEDLQKFAELVVRECAGVAEVSMPINSHPDDRLTVKNNVLKHFGVEEWTNLK